MNRFHSSRRHAKCVLCVSASVLCVCVYAPHLPLTSPQAVYVPADDITDPAPATTFSHLDATTVLSRSVAEAGIYPAVEPLQCNSRIMDPDVVDVNHYNVAMDIVEMLTKYKELQDIIAVLGIDELTEEDKLIVDRARYCFDASRLEFSINEG